MDSSVDTCIIGASGYVGSCIAARLAVDGGSVVGTYHSSPVESARVEFDFWSDELDVHDDVDGVIFAATIERDQRPGDEFENKVDALTKACSRTRFIYLSTDAVFGGETGRYSEDAPKSPANQYGRRTVRFDESIMRNCSDYCIVRPSYVYGFSGGVLDDRLARTFRLLRTGQQPTYYEDMFKSPIEVNQLAETIHHVYASSFCGTLHVGGPRMSVDEFHRRAAATFGVAPEEIHSTEMPSDSADPVDTSLDSRRLEVEFGLRPRGIRESLTCSSVEEVLCN